MPVFANGVEISDEDVFEEMQYHPAPNSKKAIEAAARTLVIRELLIQDARNLGIDTTGLPFDDAIDQLFEKVIKLPEVTEESCQQFYKKNTRTFTKDGKVQAFDDVKEIVEEYITDFSWNSAIQQYLKLLVNEAKIVGVAMDANNP